jgi:hypothetical protein
VIRSIFERNVASWLVAALLTLPLAGCGVAKEFHGANTWQLPGTQGGGTGAYTVQAQMPEVFTLQRNSRVQVNDVTVGTVTRIDLQGWHVLNYGPLVLRGNSRTQHTSGVVTDKSPISASARQLASAQLIAIGHKI